MTDDFKWQKQKTTPGRHSAGWLRKAITAPTDSGLCDFRHSLKYACIEEF
jgi:hypothetical protein